MSSGGIDSSILVRDSVTSDIDVVGLSTERILQERIESEQELKQTVRNLKKELH